MASTARRGMLRRPLQLAFRRPLSSMAESQTPVEDAIRAKITESLQPTNLEIANDSSLHAHHKAMQGSVSRETHFRLTITSPLFASRTQAARHRMVYALLKDEMAAVGGIHALQLKTRTPEEERRVRERENAETGSASSA